MARSLITGGAAGIGEALSRAAAARGDRLMITDRDTDSGRALAEELGQDFAPLDVSDRSAWQRLADTVAEPLDHLYLNAGVGSGRQPIDVLDLKWDDFDRVIAVNCDGVFSGLRLLLPRLVAAGRASVVVTSSIRGYVPGPGDPLYSMTKHALIGLVRGLAPGLAEHGIRINAVCPGPTIAPDTEYLRHQPPWDAAPWQPASAVATAALALEEDRTVTGGVYSVLAGRLERVDLPVAPY